VLVGCVLALAACQFQPQGAEIDASGTNDDDAAATATDAPDPTGDASTVDAAATIDARAIDAAATIDATACPPACTSCRNDGTCVIDCGPAQCMSGVTCPAGRPCEVNCVGNGACETGVVNCLLATSCDITCQGTDACDAGVNCAGTTCDVTCVGIGACEDGGVDCTAVACEIFCNGTDACDSHVCCTGADCDSNQCQSTNGGCCDCEGCDD
jgi:hypothetical protein